MGFKRVKINELETKLSPNFLGIPLKQIEKIVEKKSIEEKVKAISIELPDINLFAEDDIEYTYDNNGNLKEFLGNGSISVFNHSKKDRIWDARLKVLGITDFNLGNDEEVLLGNLEPEMNKKIKYNISNSEKLVNPVKISENIKVLNIETNLGKDLRFEKKPELKDTEQKIDDQIKDIGSKLEAEKLSLEEANKNVKEWSAKAGILQQTVNSLKETRDSYNRTISITHNMILKKFDDNKKKKDISDFNSSIKTLKKQNKNKKDDIKKIEKDYSKKEDLAKKEIEKEFNPQIESYKSDIVIKQEELEKVLEELTKWTKNKDKLDDTVKILEKEFNILTKEKAKELKNAEESKIDKIKKYFDSQIKPIEAKIKTNKETLDEAIKKTNESISNKKILEDDIKVIEKEIQSLEKNKTSRINTNIKNLEKEIEKEFNPQIESYRSDINVKQEELEKVLEELSKWTKNTDKLDDTVKNLKKELKTLTKEKAKELKNAEESKIDEINKNYDSKIKAIEAKFKTNKETLDEAIKKTNESISNKKILENDIKVIEKEIQVLEKNKTSRMNTNIKNLEKEIEKEFNPQIESYRSDIDVKKKELEKVLEEFTKWTKKKDKLDDTVKNLKKELKTLIKEKAEELGGAEESKIDEINKNYDSKIKPKEAKFKTNKETLDEAIKTTNEWISNKKLLENDIKVIEKEIQVLEKNKISRLNKNIKKLEKEKGAKIKKIEVQIKNNEKEIEKIDNLSSRQSSALKEIDDDYDPKLKDIDTKLQTQEKKLNDASKNYENWSEKKQKLDTYIASLEKEYDALLKADPEARSIRLKRILGEKGIEEFNPASGINISELNKNHLLLYNKPNLLQFSIILENDTNHSMENITLGKALSEDFSNFNCKSSAISEITIDKNNIIWELNEIKPREIVELEITADVIPKDKKIIGTGIIQLSYDYKDYLISGVHVDDFSAYTHAMHAINIKEKEDEPFKWDCSLYFQNNSNLNIELKSFKVLDKDKQEKYLDLNFEHDKTIISPLGNYSTERWEVYSEEEPKFYRKLDYSITHTLNKKTNINLKIEENVFNIVDAKISKTFSKTEIKSFEEAQIENLINIKNAGSIGIEAVSIEDVIPVDFRPPLTVSEIQIRNSSGIIDSNNLELKLTPEDDDPSKSHVLNLMIKGDSKSIRKLINVNDFIEVKYNFSAVKPNYKVKYEFPVKVFSYYSKYRGRNSEYYEISDEPSPKALPRLKVIHKRRNLIIGKSIFPGRNVDEFGISILVNNKSNVEINDIKITDTISKSFELVSSNIQAEISTSEDSNSNIITFTIESILPYQEKEIRYYLINISGEDIGYNELESYIYG